MDLVARKQDLFIQMGELFGPLRRAARDIATATEQEKSRAVAQYADEYMALVNEFGEFSRAQPGLNFLVEYRRFSDALQFLITRIQIGHALDVVAEEQLALAQAALDAVSVPATSMIIAPESPFTAYCKLRALCESEVIQTIVWLDAYIDETIFSRYLQTLRSGVSVTIVSQEVRPTGTKRDRERWRDFLDVSRLYARQHGNGRYRLVVNHQLHDRWTVVDNTRIYQLGGSAKDAASTKYFTISSVDATQTILATINNLCSQGTELFGPITTTHA